MDIHQKTGLAIVQLRKAQGLSQYNLALKANITFRYLSDIENGKSNLSLNILGRKYGIKLPTCTIVRCVGR